MKNETGHPAGEIGLGKYPWSQVIQWLLMALVVYAICSVFISNPFSIFVDRTTPVDYSRIMYFHGLAVSLAGITCLSISQVFGLDVKFKKIIFYCTVATIFFGITGGAINRSMEYTKLTLWYQTLSFFALDVILITLFIALLYAKNKTLRQSLSYYSLVVSSSAVIVIAALLGDLIGVILDFGDLFGMFSWYSSKIGYKVSEWNNNLLRSHSYMIVVAVMGLILSIISWKYGRHLVGKSRIIKMTGEWMAIIGLILMTIILLVSGFGSAELQIPHIFTEKGFFAPRGQSVAGIDLVDLLSARCFSLAGCLLLSQHFLEKKRKGKN